MNFFFNFSSILQNKKKQKKNKKQKWYRIIENHLAPIEKRVRVVRGHQGPIVTVKSYKETVATCSFDSTIHIWDKEKLFSSERYRNEDLLTCSVYGHMVFAFFFFSFLFLKKNKNKIDSQL